LAINPKEDYHVHCNYNDHSAPDLTVQNVVTQAENIGLQTVAFTEHVRKTSDWIPRYLDEIKSVKGNGLKIIAGFEAKILRDGSIDCLDKYAEEHFVIASFHSVYEDKKVWINALEGAIKDPNVNVIGHIAPETSFVLNDVEVKHLASMIIENGKIVELNAKYQRPSKNWIRILKESGVCFHLGSDAHSLEEVGRFGKISDLIDLVNE
jgi:putative hydrolase